MTWEYIAGFFDGEGSVAFCSNKHKPSQYRAINLDIGQKVREDRVLECIAEFLRENRVRCVIYGRYAENERHAPQQHLRVTDQASIISFLRGTLPHLIVKREKAQRALTYLESRAPFRRPGQLRRLA